MMYTMQFYAAMFDKRKIPPEKNILSPEEKEQELKQKKEREQQFMSARENDVLFGCFN